MAVLAKGGRAKGGKTHRKVKQRTHQRGETPLLVEEPNLPPIVPPAALAELQQMVEAMSRDQLDLATLAAMSLPERKSTLDRLRVKARAMEESLEMARIALGQLSLL